MTWYDEFSEQPPVPSPATIPQPRGHRTDGLRRAILTAGLAGALLVTGGVAVVWAASPDPSASPAPSQSTTPSNGGTTAPSGRQGQSGQPCPNMGGSNGSDGSGSGGGQSTNPSPDNPSPAT